MQAAALVLQKLPERTEIFDQVDESWDNAKLFFETIKPYEMLLTKQPMLEFIKLVFNELNPVVSRETIVSFHCNCSKEKFLQTMKSMKIFEKGIISSCHFCGQNYNIE